MIRVARATANSLTHFFTDNGEAIPHLELVTFLLYNLKCSKGIKAAMKMFTYKDSKIKISGLKTLKEIISWSNSAIELLRPEAIVKTLLDCFQSQEPLELP